MNLLILLAIGLFGLCLLWAVQSVVLKLAGEPLAWPLRFETRKPIVKWTSRVMIHTIWITILIGTPLALGVSPLDWLRQEFPTPVPWRDMTIAFFLMLLPIWIAHAGYAALGWVYFEAKHDPVTQRRKLIRRLIGPWPLATLEEAVFRGVILEQLLQALPQTRTYAALAVVGSAAVFSSLHFVKRPHPDRVWQPAYGLFLVGCLFGLAYVIGGRTLWLPIVVHAAAVLGVEVLRLSVHYRAPAWLIGYQEFPQCGLTGTVAIIAIAIGMVVLL